MRDPHVHRWQKANRHARRHMMQVRSSAPMGAEWSSVEVQYTSCPGHTGRFLRVVTHVKGLSGGMHVLAFTQA